MSQKKIAFTFVKQCPLDDKRSVFATYDYASFTIGGWLVVFVCCVDAGFPEHVTTLIGISVSGKPVGGVIHQPFFGSSGRTVWGLVGVGMRGTELRPREGEGLVITVTRSHMSKPVQDMVDNIKPLEVCMLATWGVIATHLVCCLLISVQFFFSLDHMCNVGRIMDLFSWS